MNLIRVELLQIVLEGLRHETASALEREFVLRASAVPSFNLIEYGRACCPIRYSTQPLPSLPLHEMCFCRVYHVHAVFAPLTVSWEGAVLGLRSVFRQARKQCTFVLRRSIELEVEVFIDTVLHLFQA